MLIFRGLSEKYINPSSIKSSMAFLPPYGLFLGVTLALTVALLVFVLLMPVEASESINGYSINQWVNAIRHAEGNDNYGILSIKCKKGAECREICSRTVRNNYKRWKRSGEVVTFLRFLGGRYCPAGGSNGEFGQVYWIKNVKYWLEKG